MYRQYIRLENQNKRILKKNGKVYIFEPLVRELHQVPEDYYRITPYGFKKLLRKYGFSSFKIEFMAPLNLNAPIFCKFSAFIKIFELSSLFRRSEESNGVFVA